MSNKKIKNKILANLIERIIVDRALKGHILFYLEMSYIPNSIGLDNNWLKSEILYRVSTEIKNANFSFFFYEKNKIFLVFSLVNILGVFSSWKPNFENKLTIWFFSTVLRQPKLNKLECVSEKVVFLSKKLLNRIEPNLLDNCFIYRHSIDNSELELELDEFATVSFNKEMFYNDQLTKFYTIPNKKPTFNCKNVMINAITCYLFGNNLVFYKTSLVKKVKSTEENWKYIDINKSLDMREVVSFLKDNFGFYVEYLDLENMLLTNHNTYKEILENTHYYFNSVSISEIERIDNLT